MINIKKSAIQADGHFLSCESMRVLQLCALVIFIVYLPALWLVSQVKIGANSPSVSSSSQLSSYGPDTLFDLKQPGWHAAKSPTYPQSITVDFHVQREIQLLGLLPQDGNTDRAPKAMRIEIANDGKSWEPVAGSDNACVSNSPQEWHDIRIDKPVKARYLRIIIFSNCGNPEFLTLKGLRVE